MSTATDQYVTVRFDPTANSQQADIIGPATSDSAGVMTAAQVAALGGGSAAIATIEADIAALQAAVAALVAGTGEINVYSPTGVGAPLRPAANAVGAVFGSKAVLTVNFDDGQLNYSDGVNWRDFEGNLT